MSDDVSLLSCCNRLFSWRHLGQVVEDVQAALGHSDVHDVLRADVDRSPGFRQDDKVVSVNGALVLDWVVFHLKRRVMRMSIEKQQQGYVMKS